MQDNEKDEELSIHLKQFIYYVNKAIRHKVIDFDRAQNWRKSNEFLPDDGNLADAPSMEKYLTDGVLETGFVFVRSDGKGEPMYIHREDLAHAIETLLPNEQDFLIKIFQEELPMPLYAAEAGISTSMAYRRKIKASKASNAEWGFNERDIVAAQNGNTEAWNKIHKHFMPYIRIIVYRHHPGYTAQDYNDRKKAAEAALLEAVMNFKFHD